MNKLEEAFESFDTDLTKSLLLEVEIELSDLDSDIPDDLTDQEYERITSIIDRSKKLVSSECRKS